MTGPALILAVEDNPASMELMGYLLRAAGHEVLEARTAAQAEQLALTCHVDLAVLDIQLPDGTGYELLPRLRDHLGPVPAIAVSAHALANDHARARAAGFDAYLVKPIDPRTFAALVAAHLPASAGDARAAISVGKGQ